MSHIFNPANISQVGPNFWHIKYSDHFPVVYNFGMTPIFNFNFSPKIILAGIGLIAKRILTKVEAKTLPIVYMFNFLLDYKKEKK